MLNIKNNIREYKKLPKEMYVLFFIRIINAIGNFVYPFTTLVLTKKMDFSPFETGIIMLITSVIYIPASILGGILADRWKYKETFILFSGVTGILFVICGFLLNSRIMTVFLILANVSNAIAQPSNTAIVSDFTNKKNRSTAFSLLYLGHNIGLSIGLIIGGTLFNDYTEYLFIGNAITIFICVILIKFLIKEDANYSNAESKINTKETNLEKSDDKGLFKIIIENKKLMFFSLISMLLAFVFSQETFTLPLHVSNVFKENGAKYFGILTSLNSITVILLTLPITFLTNKIKPSLNLSLASFFCLITALLLSVFEQLYGFILAMIIWSIGEIFKATNLNAYVMNNSPKEYLGRLCSIFSLINGAGYAITPLLMGKFIEVFDFKSSWILISIIAFIVFNSMLYLYKREREDQNKKRKIINNNLYREELK
ncbi:MAG: MFS transporter [Firmicutes bacterium]|nr:MFS transporter [Bacillota bacterium]